jgi:DNA topoisomerase I
MCDPAGRHMCRPEQRHRTPEVSREVWICMDPLGHLQATGLDAAGRKQYAERNESFGLTTMLLEHVAIGEHELVFDFPAKSGQRPIQEIADEDVLAVVATLKRRRGSSQLLAYRIAKRRTEVQADEVNAYLKQHIGGDFTVKDFRTWNATVLAAVALASVHEPKKSRASREREVSKAIKTVATYLGNTPAICRASYVDPRVIDRYHAGVTIAHALEASKGADLADARVRKRIEAAVLELLSDAGRTGRKATR